jgi:anaerobic magnesium-protoporphyrin IX monomethyl ester cyclase
MDKGTKVEEIYEATRLLKNNNIRVAFFLQFGYLTENKDDIRKTIAMVKELQPDNIGISVSYPLPGTLFYEKVKDDIKLKANWTDSDDFEMMFQGTYSSVFYRKLQRYVHKEFRKNQGIQNVKLILQQPKSATLTKVKSILKLGYYIPSTVFDRLNLRMSENER